MRSFRRIPMLGAVLATTVLITAQTTPTGAPPDIESLKRQLTPLIIERQAGLPDEALDAGALDRAYGDPSWTTDEAGVFASKSKAEMLKQAGSVTAEQRKTAKSAAEGENHEIQLSYELQDLHVRPVGGVVLANYRLVAHLVFNGEPCTKVFRNNDVYQLNGDHWQQLSHAEAVVPGKPYAYPAHPERYAEFAGEYRLLSTHTYLITTKDNKLYIGGKSLVELVPEDEHTFVMDGGEHYHIRFDSDASGEVTRMRWIEFPGVEYSAIKSK